MLDHYEQDDIGLEGNSIPFRDYLRILRKRYRIVIAAFVVVFTVIFIGTQSKTPYYQTTTQILIEKNAPVSLVSHFGYSYDPYFFQTQFELIKSKSVLYRVVEDTELASRYRDQFYPKKKDSFFKNFGRKIFSFLKIFAGSGKSNPPGKDQVEEIEEIPGDADRMASIIRSGIQVEPVKETNVVNISYTHHNPLICQMVVNAVARAYQDELLEIKMRSSNYAVKWMTAKADEEKEKLRRAEEALQKFNREHNLVTVENKPALSPQQLNEYSSRLSEAKVKRKQLEGVYKRLGGLIGDYGALGSMPEFMAQPEAKEIRRLVLEAEQNITELAKKIGPKHPLMIKAQEELQILQEEKRDLIDQYIDSVKNEYQTVVNNEANFAQLLDDAKRNALDMNEKLMQHNILKRDVESNRILYEALLTRIKEINATEQTTVVNVSVLEKAAMPRSPAGPNKGRGIRLAVLLGLVAGIALTFFVEYLDNTINSAEGLESRFHLPVLGVVELFKDTQKSLTEVVDEQSNASIVESYRMIRSAIMLSVPEKAPKTLLVTSAVPREGKTSTCVNLAKIIALEGKSVLVIDCDLRKPKLHRDLRLGNAEGLSSYLAGLSSENIVKELPGSGVSVITCGPVPPNPSELLGSDRMRQLLGELSQRFECILLDSPPLLSVTDPQVLSANVDGCLLVVRSGSTTYDLLRVALKKVRQVNMNLIGVVLNAKDLDKDKEGYSYYYYHDYYASDEPGEETRTG